MRLGPILPSLPDCGRDLTGNWNQLCGAPATHRIVWNDPTNDPPENSFTCAEHTAEARRQAWSTHKVGPFCGLPGAELCWKITADGTRETWCEAGEELADLNVEAVLLRAGHELMGTPA